MMHKRGLVAARTPKRRLFDRFRHPNVIGPVPLPLIEGDRSLIPGEYVENDFPVPMVSCPPFDKVQQRATDSLAFRFLSHHQIVDVSPRVIGEIIPVWVERDDPTRLAVYRRHESLGAWLGQEVSGSQAREKSVESRRVSRGRGQTRMHPRGDPGQKRLVLGAKRTYGDLTDPRLRQGFRRHLEPPDSLARYHGAFRAQSSPRRPDVIPQLDR